MNITNALQRACEFHNNRQLDKAETLYREILGIEPGNIDVLYNLGIVCQDQQRLDEAVFYYQEALKINPALADAYFNIGTIHYSQGQYDAAINNFQGALELDPDSADIHNNLGSAFQAREKYDEAIFHFQRAIKLDPQYDNAYNNLGIALKEKGRLHEAVPYFEKALRINPHSMITRKNLAIAILHLGTALHDKETLDQAMYYYQKAREIDPTLPDVYYNLGNYYSDKGLLADAMKHYEKCLDFNQGYIDAYNNLGIIYRGMGQLDKAEESFRRAIRINPYSYAYSNLLLTMLSNARHNFQTIYAEHLGFSRKCAEPFASEKRFYPNSRISGRRLNIGYVSPDFRRHPVAHFLEPVIVSHDRCACKVFCYSDVLVADQFTGRIQEYADQWHNIAGMSDEKVAEQIRKDQIDILVDLTGHTARNRLLLFARKPAPVQVSWIGYPATTGLPTIDYKIVDQQTDPPGTTEQFYTEKLFRMPDSFVCYLPDRDSPQSGPLPVTSAGYITFSSFNFFAKVTQEVAAVWARILERLPDSRLILKDRNFHDKTTCKYAISMFKQRGISPDRIILQSWDLPPGHLSSYNQIDIGLDTFPFNGLTTTCEALWMGVPVITLSGIAYASRAGVSVLSNIGLPELIAKTKDEYIEIAVSLSSDIEKLTLLRASLRTRMADSPVMDAKKFTADLEQCYQTIWQDWCKSTLL